MVRSYSISRRQWVKMDQNGAVSASAEWENDNGKVSSRQKGEKYIQGETYDISYEEAMNELQSTKRHDARMTHVLESKKVTTDDTPFQLQNTNPLYSIFTDYGISIPTTIAELKKAYRKVMIKLHPDRNVSKTKEEKRVIQEQYDTVDAAFSKLKQKYNFTGRKRKSHKQRSPK
jgi:hypothetical protein